MSKLSYCIFRDNAPEGNVVRQQWGQVLLNFYLTGIKNKTS
ncbi:MAG: hypothetical protein ACP5MB_09895 [bacterium]